MPLNRLRRILQNDCVVRLDSSDAIVQRVRDRIATRQVTFQNKGKQSPPSKPPASVPIVANTPRLTIRAIDLLRKIGELTTPSWANMATLSASWATRRYFWAIADRNRPGMPLRLNDDVRDLDFHQKTLLSDEFGMGMAGLVVEWSDSSTRPSSSTSQSRCVIQVCIKTSELHRRRNLIT